MKKPIKHTAFITFTATFMSVIPAISSAECHSQTEMAGRLAALGQKEIITANYKTQETGEKRGWILTLNPNDRIGYILIADKPIGEIASRICPSSLLEKVNFFDVRQPGWLPEVLFKAPNKDAEIACKKLTAAANLKRSLCAPFNEIAANLDNQGFRVTLHGFEVRQLNPEESTAVVYSIFGNLNGAENRVSGYIYASSIPEGASIKGPELYDFQYTKEGLLLLSISKANRQ